MTDEIRPKKAKEKELNNQISRNIQLKEIVCKCGCNTYILNNYLIVGLQKVRDKANEVVGPFEMKILITSGFRCKKHNRAEGGVFQSYHTKGMAADIKLYYTNRDGVNVWARPSGMFGQIVNPLNWFGGVGVYKKKREEKKVSGFIHVDVRRMKEYNMWIDDETYRSYLTFCDPRE